MGEEGKGKVCVWGKCQPATHMRPASQPQGGEEMVILRIEEVRKVRGERRAGRRREGLECSRLKRPEESHTAEG